MPEQLRIQTLNKLSIHIGSSPLELTSAKATALLVYLAVTAVPARRETLMALLWPEATAAAAAHNLRQVVYTLRKQIPRIAMRTAGNAVPLLISDRQTLTLHPSADVACDVRAFRDLLDGVRQHAHADIHRCATCRAQLQAAVSHYQGDFLSDFYLADSGPFEEWAQTVRARLQERMLDTLDLLAVTALRHHDFDTAVQLAQRQITIAPLYESAYRHLLEALARAGRSSEAIIAFDAYAEQLASELGLQPERSLRELVARIRSGQITSQSGARPVRHHNLPIYATPFIGRRALVDLVQQQILAPDCRLLSIVGPGGCGKTRLAVAAVAPLMDSDRFRDGVWFVPLVDLPVGSPIAPAIIEALPYVTLSASATPAQNLCAHVRHRSLLILLDNAEHQLTAENLALLRDLVQSGPDVTLVVTSRTRLRLAAEQLVPLAGLDVPPTGLPLSTTGALAYEAVALFVACARRVRPDFELNDDNLAAVTAVCRQVEGFPLAIELAAQWLQLLPTAALAAELQRSFTDIQSGAGDPGVASGRAVFETSWRLLTDNERDLCRVLAVFRGGVTHDAAEAVGNASLPVLLRLSHASWIQRSEDGRYHMHELLRQYITADAQRTPARHYQRQQQHARYFAQRCGQLNEQTRGPQQQAARDAIGAEFDNVRAAWLWLVEQGQFDLVTDALLPALCSYARVRDRILELESLIDHTRAALPEDADGTRTAVALAAADELFERGWCRMEHVVTVGGFSGFPSTDPALLNPWWTQFLQLPFGAIDPWLAAAVATRCAWQHDLIGGIDYLQKALAACVAQDWRWQEALIWQCLGSLHLFADKYSAASDTGETSGELPDKRICYERSVGRFREEGDAFEQAVSLLLLSLCQDLGRFEETKHLFEQVGEQRYALFVDVYQANYLVLNGQQEVAFPLFAAATAAFEALGDKQSWDVAASWYSLAAVRYGSVELGHKLRCRLQRLHRRTGNPHAEAWDHYELGDLARLQGESRRARKLINRAMGLFEALDAVGGKAQSHRALGDLALSEGDLDGALAHHSTAVELPEDMVGIWQITYTHACLGRTYAARGDWTAARANFGVTFDYVSKYGAPELALHAVVGTAELLAAQQRYQEAATLAAYIIHEPRSWHEMRWNATAVLDTITPHLTTAALASATAAGQQLDLATAVALCRTKDA